ncbi:MAG: sialidase family protein [Planctomycetota bacterium]
MRVIDQGLVCKGLPGSPLASNCFPSVASLSDGTILVAFRRSAAKDSPSTHVVVCASKDAGRSWSDPVAPVKDTAWNGTPGSFGAMNLSEVSEGRVLASILWVDRTRPDLPFFNPETEGLLPCKNLLYESRDGGASWTFLEVMDTSPFTGRPTTTGPVLPVAPGELAAFYETNKDYDDPSPWRHRSVVKFSRDGGRTWPEHAVTTADPAGRVFYWDQRVVVLRPRSLLAFLWTYDREAKKDLPIHWTRSDDAGRTWTPPRSTGLVGQVAYPAALSDGRIVLPYVDRYASASIRVRLSVDEGRSWEQDELTLWPGADERAARQHHGDGMGQYLQSMQQWSFGLPCAATMPGGPAHAGSRDHGGDVFISYYAGDPRAQSIHWALLRA